MIFGYARVSTTEQKLDRQIDLLTNYGTEKIFTEKITGKNMERKELNRLIDQLRPGDSIVVESLSRLGRSTKDLLFLIDKFNELKVNFISLKEQIDTTTPTGKLIFHIFASISEFERELISERVRSGLASARVRGRVGGRPKKKQKLINMAISLYESKKHTLKEIHEQTGVSPATLYRYLNKGD
ncbi:recombinase family protein (plasmid) [Mycoplasmatota bacterium]|nr:recombinase family protein [Mycoplasmatota bacterium]